MPTFKHGKDTKVWFNQYDVSSYFNNAAKTASIETGETTCFGKSFKTYIPGLGDSTATLGGLFDGTTGAVDDIFTGILGSSTDNVQTIGLVTPTYGTRVWLGKGIATSYQTTSPVGDVVSISADFQADDGYYNGVALYDFTSASASANLTSVDGTAASTGGWMANLHVTTNTRSAVVDFKLQDSADNASFADVTGGAFTQIGIGLTGKESIRNTTAGVTLRRYVRGVVTLTAGTGAVTFMLSIARLNGQ